jgi:lipopolysaccharide transport system permease protein
VSIPGPAAGQVETIILPHRGWFEWRLDQLWRYKDLISLFVWRDFVSVYKQTIFGPTWHLFKPLLATMTLTLVFSRMAGLSTDGVPPFLFYMSGYVAWSYFASALDNISKTFVANSHLMGKVYFHRLVIPVSLIFSNLISFGIQLGMFLVVLIGYVLAGYSIQLNMWTLAVPLLLCIIAGYALAGGIIICAVTTRYRDLSYLVTLGTQLLMYLTPVIYPTSLLSPRYQRLVLLNPLAPLIEGFRRGLLGVGTVTPEQVAWSASVMLLLLTIGMMMFSRVERTFMDTV